MTVSPYPGTDFKVIHATRSIDPRREMQPTTDSRRTARTAESLNPSSWGMEHLSAQATRPGRAFIPSETADPDLYINVSMSITMMA